MTDHPRPVLTGDDAQQLRNLAKRTWLYFEQFVGPEDNWLPPDHFQEAPLKLVAHRTSPTNIGLMLLATAAAYDFGYESLLSVAVRLRDTFRLWTNWSGIRAISSIGTTVAPTACAALHLHGRQRQPGRVPHRPAA
ncbi:MAG: hypothetical protein R2851_03630 [Caldilineaceae bacterium]